MRRGWGAGTDAIASSVAAGVAYAVAAGNSDNDAATFSPANHPDVLTVSALADFDGEPGGLGSPTCRTDQDDTLADFSNWGATVEIAAPGVCIRSTWNDGGYNTISGTSMALPHAAGALALLASAAPPSGAAAVKNLYSTVRNAENFDWTDDSGDGIQEPLLDVGDATVFDPALVSGSGGGGPDAAGIHVGDLDGSSVSHGSSWTATVTVEVHDVDHTVEGGSTVDLTYDGRDASGTVRCTTDTTGRCPVSVENLPKRTSSLTFTVTAVTDADGTYRAADDHDPDGDSDGTTIVVNKP